MTNPVLCRRRLIPDECVRLTGDVIHLCNDEIILTSWEAIRARKDLDHGTSCYFLNEGLKLSQFFRLDGSFICWYADIVIYEYDEKENVLTSIDLLVDVFVYPDGFVKVLDLDELAQALEQGLLNVEQAQRALHITDKLLKEIYGGEFEERKKCFRDCAEMAFTD